LQSTTRKRSSEASEQEAIIQESWFMKGTGTRLGRIRRQWGLSLREVEQRSFRFAEEWGDPSCRISASWLNRLEREEHELTVNKLVVLAYIYNIHPEQLLSSRQVGQAQSVETAPLRPMPDFTALNDPPDETTLLPAENGLLFTPYRRGIIGKLDQGLDPMIPAGSMVQIETRTRTITSRKDRIHEIQRPIYFLMTRDTYICGWCELDEKSDWLTLIPHPLSSAPSRRWKYPQDVENVGRVTAVAIPLTP
jgi:transcriptional regulator with XRE-family HTH domain